MSNQSIVIHYSEREQGDLSGMSRWFKGVGLAVLLAGILAAALPQIATLTVELLVGAVLLFTGVMHLVHAFQVSRWRSTTWEMLLAAIFLLAAAVFLLYPFSGALALTLLLGFFFLIHGGFKIPLALALRQRPGWGWMLASGILSIILGMLLLIGLPGTALWVIGLILGVDLIFTGITLMIIGAKVKHLSE